MIRNTVNLLSSAWSTRGLVKLSVSVSVAPNAAQISEAQLAEVELVLVDTAQQFDAGNGSRLWFLFRPDCPIRRSAKSELIASGRSRRGSL
jgi:hypothetical protein